MNRPLWGVLLVITWLVLSACRAPASTDSAAAVQAPAATQAELVLSATPEAVLADLSAEASLEASAADLAAALGVEPQRVRVRIQSSTCTLCTMQEDTQLHSIEGISLEDAGKRLVPGDGFFLFIGRFTCFYRYDGAIFSPRTCQYAPV